MTDETIRTRAINVTREHWKTVLHVASWALAALVAYEFSQGHKQAETEIQANDFKEFKDDMKAEIRDLKASVQDVKMNQVSDHATLVSVGSDVHDLKMMADHASDVAETFKVPRLTGHRAKH